ncbi:MAG: MopE-related protein [Myxococcota bacterium]|nr:MopE-related protein [Myxococcota bacterium]
MRGTTVGLAAAGMAVLSLAACGGASDDSGGTGCTTSLDCPGGVCIDGRCRRADGGGDVDGGGGCDPAACAIECTAAGFGSGTCTERGCQCRRDADAGDVVLPDVPPGTEICGDGLDNDGDGAVDENCSCLTGATQGCYSGDPAVAGIGACRLGTQACEEVGEFGEWGACVGSGLPRDEVCGDGVDNDCDGTADEGCLCTPGETRPCYTGPAGTEGVGLCAGGTQSCALTPDGGAVWGDCMGQRLPQPDVCDGLDNDCNGVPDQLCECPPGAVRPCYDGPAGTRRIGECYDGNQACILEPGGLISWWGPCIGWGGPRAETCDGLDNDCDGRTDPDCRCRPGESRACYTGPPATRGVYPCRDGIQACVATGTGTDWGPCSGDVLPAAETCGDRVDNNCDGRTDEGCDCTTMPAGRPPTVTCPADVTTRALTTVILTATATDDCRIDSRRWEVVGRPAGSAATPASPSSASTPFTPDLVGEYRLRFTATDNEGLSASCEVRVTATGQGLRIELFWNIAGDVDLHLLHPTAAAWFTSPGDCYYANMRPSWDAAGTADDPRLDIDDTTTTGPENINIDVPVVGNTYRVGVHHYRSDGCRSATVRIYCGDVSLVPVTTSTRSICGNSGGDSRDHWRVADVRWNLGDTCTVTRLDTVIPDSTARTTR